MPVPPGNGFVNLSRRTGPSVAGVIELAAQNRLSELFDDAGEIGVPLTPGEALRRLERRQCAPGEEPRPTTPAQRLGHLKELRFIWDIEAASPEDNR